MMFKQLFLILLLTGCANAVCEYGSIGNNATYNNSGYTCVQVKAGGHENYGLYLCEAASNECTYYNHTEYMPLDITKDYIIKVAPIQIQTAREFSNYFTTYGTWLRIVLVIVVILMMYGLIKVML